MVVLVAARRVTMAAALLSGEGLIVFVLSQDAMCCLYLCHYKDTVLKRVALWSAATIWIDEFRYTKSPPTFSLIPWYALHLIAY